MTLEQARRLWRALGFPEHGGEKAFTRSDAEAAVHAASGWSTPG